MKTTTITPGEQNALAADDKVPRGRELQALLAAETLAAMRQMRDTSTELIAALRGNTQNSVLDVRTATIPAAGFLQFEYRVATGSVFVVNSGGNDITMVSGPGGSDRPPGDGVGAALIPAGTAQLINVAGHYVTFYGTASQRFSFQVYSKPQPPAAGVAGNTTALRPGTVLDASGGAAAGAAGSATLAAATLGLTYITGFELTWLSDGTGTVNDLLTVTGPTSTFNYRVSTVAGAAGSLIVPFNSPVPAAAINTAIVVGLAGAAGRATASIVAHGFRL